MVLIPGGKWVNIDRTKHSDVPMYLAEHGIASFSIDYRSALEFPYPAAVDDVSSAIRWVRAHAADYQVDPSELGAMGVSSGGHLAALVGAMGTGPLDRGDRVSVVVSFSGMMDLRTLVDSSDPEMRFAVQTFLACAGGPPCADVAREASPITYVDGSDPPMVLVNGSDEINPPEQAESMARALTQAGVDSHVEIAQGGHGAGYGGGNKILDHVIPYIQAWIAGRPAPSPAPQGGSSEGEDGGKGGAAPPPSASPAAPSPEDVKDNEPEPAPERVVAVGRSSPSVLVVAIAMLAVLVVIGELFVITRLRRRVAALTARRPEDGGTTPASAEGA
jgi:dienelactone hydrolase